MLRLKRLQNLKTYYNFGPQKVNRKIHNVNCLRGGLPLNKYTTLLGLLTSEVKQGSDLTTTITAR